MNNIIKIPTILFFMLLLASCGGGGGGGNSPKDLFSLWNVVATDAPLDLRGGDFSTPLPISFYFVGGEQCNCTLTVLGTQSSGSYVLNFCAYQLGSGASDPGCNALNDTGSYSKTSSILTITNSSMVSTDYD